MATSKNFEVKNGLSVGGTERISSAGVGTFTDLNVTGTTTTIDTATLQVQDKNIVINYGSGDTSSTASGAGITIQDAVNSSTDATLLWDSSNDEFDFSHAVTAPSLKSTGAATFDSTFTSTGLLLSANTSLYNQDAAISYYSASNGVYVNGAGTNGWLRLNASGAENARNSIDLYGQNGGDYVKIKAADTDTLYVGAGGAGRVGIGTSTPNGLLQVGSGTTSGDTTNPAIQIGRTGTYRFGMYASTEGAVIENKNGDDGIQFRVKTKGEALRIDGVDGHVGIGTTSPLGPLHVVGDANATGISHTYVYDSNSLVLEAGEPSIQLRAQDSGTHGGSLLWRYGDNVFSAIANPTDDTIDWVYGVSNANSFDVHAGTNLSSYKKIMTIGADGKVGVGTSSPDRVFHVKSSSEGTVAKFANTGNVVYIELNAADQVGGDAGYIAYNNTKDMGFWTDDTERMRIDSTGNITTTNHPIFMADEPAATAGGANNVVIFGGENSDVGGHYNQSNGRFTAPVAGKYFFTVSILLDPNNTGNSHYARVSFRKNGTISAKYGDTLNTAFATDAGSSSTVSAYQSISMSTIIALSANDYVDIVNSGTMPTYGTGYGSFAGFLVG